jgi:hypothetical protein
MRCIILLLATFAALPAVALPAPLPIEGETYNAAIQAVLDKNNAVHLPKRDQPYLLDGPIILKSGQKITADPDTVIQLKPGTNTCMVRNEHIIGFADKPVPADTKPDTDIHIEGGIWTTFGEGNTRGFSSKQAARATARTASSCCKTSAA